MATREDTDMAVDNTGAVRGRAISSLSVVRALPDKNRWVLVKPASSGSGGGLYGVIIVDGSGRLIWHSNDDSLRGMSANDAQVDDSTEIAIVSYSDDHVEAIDMRNGKTLWTISSGLARATNFTLRGAGNGYVAASTQSVDISLDSRTGKQIWTGTTRTAWVPLGELTAGRLLSCEGSIGARFGLGRIAISVPAKAPPLGLDDFTPLYP